MPPGIPCPTTFRGAVLEACATGTDAALSYCNACGGTSLRYQDKYYGFEMHFDTRGALIGVTLLEDDPVGPCMQREFVFGRYCSPSDGTNSVISCAAVREAEPEPAIEQTIF